MKETLVALAGGAKRRLSTREEELLGLLAGFPDGDGGGGGGSDRELSFSDLIEAGARPPSADADLGVPTPRDDRLAAAATAPSSPGRHETAAAAAAAVKRQLARQWARRSGGSKGSFGGGGDGVLLNFYVPGLLTRSMTTPRPTRGPLSPGPVKGDAPAKPVRTISAAGKASRTQAALGIGCFPALWGRGRRPAKACS